MTLHERFALAACMSLALLGCGSRTGLDGIASDDEGSSAPDASVADAGPPAQWAMSGHDVRHTSRGGANGPQTPSVKWTVTVTPNSYGDTAVAADGTIYAVAGGALVALEPATGATRWSAPLLTGNDYLTAPAIAPDGTIYVLGGNNSTMLFAVNADGTRRFGVDTGVVSDNAPLTIGDDGTIYIGHGAQLDVYRRDGTHTWSYVDKAGEPFASPAVGADGTVYATCDDFALRAFTSTGTVKWTVNATFQIFAAPSVASDGTIYFGSYDQNLYAVAPEGAIRWTFTTAGNIGFGSTAAPALGADGTIYITSDDTLAGSFLYAVTPSGAQKWRFQPKGRLLSPGVVDAEGSFYVIDTNGMLYAIDANGAVKFTLPLGPSSGGAPSLAADGTLYATTGDGKLHALGP